MSNLRVYTPKPESEVSTNYGSVNRPLANEVMFFNAENHTYAKTWTDHYTNNNVGFSQTLTGTDNKHTNVTHVWRYTSGYGRMGGYTKNSAYISWHIGSVPDLHSLSAIKGYPQHLLPGYVGLRFQYRWPYDNDVNYWSNSPVYINNLMLHYYNFSADEIWSYSAGLHSVSTNITAFWPDRFVEDNNRRSNDWRGCYWKPLDGGARNEIRNNQLFMVGASFEMRFSDRGSAKHSRCMDIRNLTPIWDKGGAQDFRPVLAKARRNPWQQTADAKQELYLV